MKLSTRTRYGLRAMIDLTVYYQSIPILIKDIAKRQNISPRYLEHIMLSLKKGGLVRSVSGAKGGFMLQKPPSDITVLDIVTILEGPLNFVPCLENTDNCDRATYCSVRELWNKMKITMTNTLKSTTLKELVENKKKREIFYQI